MPLVESCADNLVITSIYIRFPLIWENYVDIAWGRQLYDGSRPSLFGIRVCSAPYYCFEKEFSATTTSYRLEGLTPGTEYCVQIRYASGADSDSKNAVIWSPWSVSRFSTLKKVELSVGTVGPDFLNGKVEIDPRAGSQESLSGPSSVDPITTHIYSELREIQLRALQRTHLGTFLPAAVKTIKFCDWENAKGDFFILDMPPNGIFSVAARGISAHGESGEWTSPVVFSTLLPVELKVQEIGEEYCIVRWQRQSTCLLNTSLGNFSDNVPAILPRDEEYVDAGRIEKLALELYLQPSQREMDIAGSVAAAGPPKLVSSKQFTDEYRMFRFNNLLSGRNYNIRFKYLNVIGSWSPETDLAFTTLFSVASPRVVAVGKDFIQLSWGRSFDGSRPSEPEDAIFGVDEWELRCRLEDCERMMRFPRHETETRLANMASGVQYAIAVRALIPGGAEEWGPWSSELLVNTLTSLRCISAASGETWIRVSWDRENQPYPDEISRYHVQLRGSGNGAFSLSKYFAADCTSYTFTGLSPGMAFTATAQEFTGCAWSDWSEPTEVHTCESCVAKLLVRGEDFVEFKPESEYYKKLKNGVTDGLQKTYQLKVVRPVSCASNIWKDAVAAFNGSKSGSSVPPEVETILEVGDDGLPLRVDNVPAYSRVVVTSRAFDLDLNEWGLWGREVTFRTLPYALTIVRLAETAAEVSWSRFPRILSSLTDEEIAEGTAKDSFMPVKPTKFILRLCTATYSRPTNLKEIAKFHFEENQPHLFTFSQLTADSQYACQLNYYDNGRWSHVSAPVHFMTAPALETIVLSVSSESATVGWGRWVKTLREAANAESSLEEKNNANCAIPLDERYFRILVEDIHASSKGFSSTSHTFNLRPRSYAEGAVPGYEEEQDPPSSTPSLQYTVEGHENKYTIECLRPGTLYRISVCGSLCAQARHGSWTDPVYVMTSPIEELVLDVVGETYCTFAFRGGNGLAQIPLTDRFPGCRLVVPEAGLADSFNQGCSYPYDPVEGNVIYVQGEENKKYQIRVVQSEKNQSFNEMDNESMRVVFDSDVSPSIGSLFTISNLQPATVYYAQMRAVDRKDSWGSWKPDPPLEITTLEARSIWVETIDENGILLAWAKAEPCSDVLAQPCKWRIKIENLNETENNVTFVDCDVSEDRHYLWRGFTVNTNYAISIASIQLGSKECGQFSAPIYVTVAQPRVEVRQSGEQWAELRWKNPFDLKSVVPAVRSTLLYFADSQKTRLIPLEQGAESHLITGLQAGEHYSAQVITIEQRQSPLDFEAFFDSCGEVGRDHRSDAGYAGGKFMEIPLLADGGAEPKSVEGCISFSTQPELVLSLGLVGDNFVVLQWASAESKVLSNEPSSTDRNFEIDVCPENSKNAEENDKEGLERERTVFVKGCATVVSDLTPGSKYSFRIRAIPSENLSVEEPWSNPPLFVDLSEFSSSGGDVFGSGGTLSGNKTNPRLCKIGETSLSFEWDHDPSEKEKSGELSVQFELQLTAVDEKTEVSHNGSDASNKNKTSVETKENFYYFDNLERDQFYEFQIRPVVYLSIPTITGSTTQVTVPCAWLDKPILCMTLSPMIIHVTRVTETTSVISWLRRGFESPLEELKTSSSDNEGGNTRTIALRPIHEAIAGIDSVRVCVFKGVPSSGDTSNLVNSSQSERGQQGLLVMDKTYNKVNDQFSSCWTRVYNLEPGIPYYATVCFHLSCSSNWEDWTAPVTFITAAPLQLFIDAVASSTVALHWTRSCPVNVGNKSVDAITGSKGDASEPPQIVSWEVRLDALDGSNQPLSLLLDVSHNAYCIDCALPDTLYAVAVRACYAREQPGLWSENQYVVTFPNPCLDVRRIGEDFATVFWTCAKPRTVSEYINRPALLEATREEFQQKIDEGHHKLQKLRKEKKEQKETDFNLNTAEAEPLNLEDLEENSDVITKQDSCNVPTNLADLEKNQSAEKNIYADIEVLEQQLHDAEIFVSRRINCIEQSVHYPRCSIAAVEISVYPVFENQDKSKSDNTGSNDINRGFIKQFKESEGSFFVDKLYCGLPYSACIRSLFQESDLNLESHHYISQGDSSGNSPLSEECNKLEETRGPTAVDSSYDQGEIQKESSVNNQEFSKAAIELQGITNAPEEVQEKDGETEIVQQKEIKSVSEKTSINNTLSYSKANGNDAQPSPVSVSGPTFPWTQWSSPFYFLTLVPLTVRVMSTGSYSVFIRWNVGTCARHFPQLTPNQLDALERREEEAEQEVVTLLSEERERTSIEAFHVCILTKDGEVLDKEESLKVKDPRLRQLYINGEIPLQPGEVYSVSVRSLVNKNGQENGGAWGEWCTPVFFRTMPPILAKLQSVTESIIEFILWRDKLPALQEICPSSKSDDRNCAQRRDEDGAAYSSDILSPHPTTTEHRLVTGHPPRVVQTLTIEEGTSVLITLDSLTIDSVYHIGTLDRVGAAQWQHFVELIVAETLPCAPGHPRLLGRRSNNAAITWDHERRQPRSVQYLYEVEVALRESSEHQKASLEELRRGDLQPRKANMIGLKHGPFCVLGYSDKNELCLAQLDVPVSHCYFRVRCCKTHQTTDGQPRPVFREDPAQPSSVSIEDRSVYCWSRFGPVGHFRAPRVPERVTNLHITRLTHNSCRLNWNKPVNWREHEDSGLSYRVCMSNNYQDRFTCVAETTNTWIDLVDLVINCNYRVAVLVNSSVGRSKRFPILHFTTRSFPLYASRVRGGFGTILPPLPPINPTTTSLPPRTLLRTTEDNFRRARAGVGAAGEELAPIIEEPATNANSPRDSELNPAAVNSIFSPPQTPDSSMPGSRPKYLPPLQGYSMESAAF